MSTLIEKFLSLPLKWKILSTSAFLLFVGMNCVPSNFGVSLIVLACLGLLVSLVMAMEEI